MALKEMISILQVSKRFRPSSARSGECRRNIPGIQAALQIAATEELVQEAGIEAVPGADRVHDFHRRSRTDKAIASALRRCPFCAALYNNERHDCSQFGYSVFNVLSSGNLLRLARVW